VIFTGFTAVGAPTTLHDYRLEHLWSKRWNRPVVQS